MKLRFLLTLALGLLGFFAMVVLLTPQTAASVDVKAAEDYANPHYTSTFPTEYHIDILLEGSTREQVDVIKVTHDTDFTRSSIITKSFIQLIYDRGDHGIPIAISYDQPGNYTILVEVYNTSYANGTPKPEDEQLIQAKSFSLTISLYTQGNGNDNDNLLGSPFQLHQLFIIAVGVICILGIFGALIFHRENQDSSLSPLEYLPPQRAFQAPQQDSVESRYNTGGGYALMPELRELTKMRENGLLTDDELTAAKEKILKEQS